MVSLLPTHLCVSSSVQWYNVTISTLIILIFVCEAVINLRHPVKVVIRLQNLQKVSTQMHKIIAVMVRV